MRPIKSEAIIYSYTQNRFVRENQNCSSNQINTIGQEERFPTKSCNFPYKILWTVLEEQALYKSKVKKIKSTTKLCAKHSDIKQTPLVHYIYTTLSKEIFFETTRTTSLTESLLFCQISVYLQVSNANCKFGVESLGVIKFIKWTDVKG